MTPAPDAAAYLASRPIRTITHMPDCPPALFANGKAMWKAADDPNGPDPDNVNRWALRGAIAAGMSVFNYLDTSLMAAIGGQAIVAPAYNECQLLPGTP